MQLGQKRKKDKPRVNSLCFLKKWWLKGGSKQTESPFYLNMDEKPRLQLVGSMSRELGGRGRETKQRFTNYSTSSIPKMP